MTVTGKTVYRQRSKERNKIANKENTKVDPNTKRMRKGEYEPVWTNKTKTARTLRSQ